MKLKIVLFLSLSLIMISAHGQWTKLTVPGADNYISVYFYNESNGFLANSSDLYKTTNGGLSWTLLDIPQAYDNMIDIHMLDTNVIWLTTDNNYPTGNDKEGNILKSEDGGSSWEVKYSLPYLGFKHFFFLDKIHIWVTTFNSLVYRSTDGGETWAESNELDMMNIYGLYFIKQ